jgi:hypothetical protein
LKGVDVKNLQWKRILLGAAVAEVLALATLVAVVIVYEIVVRTTTGAALEEPAIQAWAERAGRVVGPLAGATWTLLCAARVARGASGRLVAHGLAVGIVLAIFDVGVLLAMRVPFELLFVGSNLLRIAAGAAGGAWARSRRSPIG